jgi:hypothetical protein
MALRRDLGLGKDVKNEVVDKFPASFYITIIFILRAKTMFLSLKGC